MKLSANHNFLALLLVFLSSITLPLTMHADNIDKRSGSFRRENRGINTGINNNRSYPNVSPNINIYRPDYIRPNVNVYHPDYNRPNVNVYHPDYNRPNVNVYHPDYNRPNVKVYRPDYNRPNVNVYHPDYNRPNVNVYRPDYNRPNVNVYRPDYNRPNVNIYRPDYNRPNVNVYHPDYNRPKNIRLRGGGWYGSGYSTPLGWGSLTFTSGLALGTVINPPPYYSPVVLGRDNYIYSDGVFLQPRDSFYVVVKPPIGAVVPLIPEGCTSLNTNGVGYYNCSSVIYQPFHQDRNVVYRVVSY